MKIIHTRSSSLAGMIARLTLATVMFPHGAQKLLGWFGGNGLQRTTEFFTQNMHMSPAMVWMIILGEFLGSIALFFGILTRIAALGIIAIMAGAIALVHNAHGFFMNWSGQQSGEGYEYHILAIGLALVALILGGGKASIDAWLTNEHFTPENRISGITSDSGIGIGSSGIDSGHIYK